MDRKKNSKGDTSASQITQEDADVLPLSAQPAYWFNRQLILSAINFNKTFRLLSVFSVQHSGTQSNAVNQTVICSTERRQKA